jgi:acyl phosphate:glycerol-3-phosphate acyltransferase
MLTPLVIAAAVGYLLGSLPFGYLIARTKGVNIFEHGSRNPGATNVLRVLGRGPGYLAFCLDMLKGAAAVGWPMLVYATIAWQSGSVSADYNTAYPAAVAGLIGALLGHSFSCFTKFKGGKGVATSAGGLFVLLPVEALIAGAVWIITFYVSRYVSLASILAAVALPGATFFLSRSPLLLWLSVLIAAFVIVRHRANIVRLFNGTENKFAKKPESVP